MSETIDNLAKVFFEAARPPLQWETRSVPEQAYWRAGVVALLNHLFDHPTEEMLRVGAGALAVRFAGPASNSDASAAWRGMLACLVPRIADDEARVAAGVRAAREMLDTVCTHTPSGLQSFTSLLPSPWLNALVRAILAAADKEPTT